MSFLKGVRESPGQVVPKCFLLGVSLYVYIQYKIRTWYLRVNIVIICIILIDLQ